MSIEIQRGDLVSFSPTGRTPKPDAPKWRVRYIDPTSNGLTLDLVTSWHGAGRTTARFNVDPKRVVVVRPARGTDTGKRDVNGRTLVAKDTVVWETQDGLSHHAGYVVERQDSDDIDVKVAPLGSGGHTYVIIRARHLRLAKKGNEGGRHTVADLVDMADALENPLKNPKTVAAPCVVEQDDLTVGEATVPVSGPKFEVMSADYHRNGVSGRGFYVGIVKHWEDGEPRLLQIIATPEEDAPEDVSKVTFDDGQGVQIYVTDLMVVAKQGTVAFGRNSFRGDHFFAEARAIIIQTRNQWDNQMLSLRS